MNKKALLFAVFVAIVIVSYFFDSLHRYVYTYREYIEGYQSDICSDPSLSEIECNDKILNKIIVDYKNLEEIDPETLDNYEYNMKILNEIDNILYPESEIPFLTQINNQKDTINDTIDKISSDIEDVKEELIDYDDGFQFHN